MNRDDVLWMAREAGFKWPEIQTLTIEERLERFATLAAEWGAKQEREACAKVCEEYDTARQDNYACLCANAIRKRGEVKP